MSIDIINQLNEEQKEAVRTTEGYIRIIAGAGSGKTKTLTSRYIYIVEKLGVSTDNILCVTFTNKAAREMRKRIREEIGDNDTGLICTFHGFCKRLLKEDIYTINYPSNFRVMDVEDQNTLLRIIYEELNLSLKDSKFSTIRDIIRTKKEKLEYINSIINLNNEELYKKYLESEDKYERIFWGYIYYQKKNYNLDFNDLIFFTLYILDNNKEVKDKWQRKLQYIMVDEFQDVSLFQYNLVRILSEYNKNLFIVGDPDQTIYSWRGSNVNYILNFDKEYGNSKTIIMDKNYRSSKNIIDASNSLISKNKNRIDKNLRALKSEDVPVIYNHFINVYKEAEWICNTVKDIVYKGGIYNEIAILYRAHYVSRAIEEAFIKNKIPYKLYSGIGFYQRKEIKDILSYLTMIVYEDDISLIRIVNNPKRGFGKKRMKIIKDFADNNNCTLYEALKKNLNESLISKSQVKDLVKIIEKYKQVYRDMKISDLLSQLLDETGYEKIIREDGEYERLDNLSELKNSILDYERSANEKISLDEYLQEISLFTNEDIKNNKDSVKMMTIHTSKGLEFPHVFICGLNEGIFPSFRVSTIDEMEEERRLAYVGYTRAKQSLFLSDAEGENYNNSYRYPSRFIFNTSKRHLNYIVELNQELIDKTVDFINKDGTRFNIKQNYYNIGDLVEHEYFGIGKVLNIDLKKSFYEIKFKKLDTSRNISFLSKMNKIAIENESKNKQIKYEKENSDKEEKLKELKKEIEDEYKKKKEEMQLKLKEENEKERIILKVKREIEDEEERNKLINRLKKEEIDSRERFKKEIEDEYKKKKEEMQLRLKEENEKEYIRLKEKREIEDEEERNKLIDKLKKEEIDRRERLEKEIENEYKRRREDIRLKLEVESQEKYNVINQMRSQYEIEKVNMENIIKIYEDKKQKEIKEILDIKQSILEIEEILFKKRFFIFGKKAFLKKRLNYLYEELRKKLSIK